jgi:hypothetical protein
LKITGFDRLLNDFQPGFGVLVQEGGPSGSITSPGQPISSETRSYFNHVARHLSSKVTSGGGKLTVVEINIIGLFRLIKLI